MSNVIIAVLLMLILWVLYRFLKTLSSTLNTIQQRVQSINSHVHGLLKPLHTVADSHLAEHPAGKDSPKHRKRESLVRVYADHLVRTRQLSPDEATVRARFELHRFGEDTLTSEIDGLDAELSERFSAEEAFYNSGVLDRDIDMYPENEFHLLPRDLFAPLYSLLVKQGYQQGEEVEFDRHGTLVATDYREFVKDRAIIKRLEALGVLVRTNGDDWRGRPAFTVRVTDLDQLRALLYEGGSSHDNAHFEEQYNSGKLRSLLVRVRS